jgi:hypothetical protein
MAEQAKQDAQEAVHAARTQVESMLGQQKSVAAGQIEGLAKALHTTGEQLRSQHQDPVANWVERAAEGLDRLCDTLRERDINSLAAQIQDYARRQPVVVLGGAVAAGFLVARFLKSSSSSSHAVQSYADDSNYQQPMASSEPMNTPEDFTTSPTPT